jgi:hypothetical protein
MAMDIAVTNKDPNLPWVHYDEENGAWIFEANAKIMNYEKLKDEYKSKAIPLSNA